MVDKLPPDSPSQPSGESDSPAGEGSAERPGSPGLVPPEALEAIPRESRGTVEQFMSMAVGSVNPIAQKITSEHITGLIGLIGKDHDNELADRKDKRRIYAIVGIIVLLAVVGFATLLVVKENNDLLGEVIKLAAIGVGSFVGGYGFGRIRR